MLCWLDSDRDHAGQRYEEIRAKLILIFARRGCSIPEELTDETFNRVARRVGEVSPSFVGDPALYFYGVAQNVYLEYVRKKPPVKPLPAGDVSDGDERNLACLDRCLGELDGESRELIVEYYTDDKHAKIGRRRRLADDLGITPQSLRMRASRIRARLHACVVACVNAQA